MRLFFACWPTENVRSALERCSREIVRHCGGRAIPAENLHLTLAFLGEVEEKRLADLMDLARNIAASPFELVLDEIGYWPRQRLAWAGCRSMPREGETLLRSLKQSLLGQGFSVDARPFVPHVTLVRHARCAEVALEHSLVWPIGEFHLVESVLRPAGSHYRSLASWSLSIDFMDSFFTGRGGISTKFTKLLTPFFW